MGRLGLVDWSGVEGVQVEIGRDVIGFGWDSSQGVGVGEVKGVGGLGSEEFGSSLNQGARWGWGRGVGVRDWVREVGVREVGVGGVREVGVGGVESGVGLGSGGLGLGELVGIGGELGSKELE